MRLSEIENKAKNVGIKNTWRFSRKQLIRQIQKTEGNFDCFASGRRNCEQLACCWRIDCIR